MTGPVQVDVQVAVDLPGVPAEPVIRQWLERVIDHVGTGTKRDLELSVKIVDEEEGRALNRQYRNQDSATNVLSFPASEVGLNEVPPGLPLALGDIVICAPLVFREASDQGKKSPDHWAHLLVHGALHLLGYDHETDTEARQMETLEASILALGGVENPYKSRD